MVQNIDWKSRVREHWVFLAILAGTAVVRLAMLFLSQTHVHSDEAVIGLMGKHIQEGHILPFYMSGQVYNAGAAWEAYLAAVAFMIFGVGVIPLKLCMVVLSLVCLGLFYRLVDTLYGRWTAVVATVVFALFPSLLKWHFQVRGYSFYFLSIPLLTLMFWAVDGASVAKVRRVFLLGLVSGLSLWNLELVLTLVAALWVLLVVRRKLSVKLAGVGLGGFLIGYGPAILYNVTHRWVNWQMVFAGKTSGGALGRPAAFIKVFFEEMPKFFGADTVLWYYPEKPLTGIVLYLIAAGAVGVAVWPFLKSPSKLWGAIRGEGERDKDLLLVVLTLACFVPYLAAPMRVPGYFLGGAFFLSLLIGRLVMRCFVIPKPAGRFAGAALLAVVVNVGVLAILETGGRNQIETLTFSGAGNKLHMTRVPGADIEAVKGYFYRNEVKSAWATISFVNPLLFETREAVTVSGSVFGWKVGIEPKPEAPGSAQREVFVVEADSPFRAAVEAQCKESAGVAPFVTKCGLLTVIEARIKAR